MMERIVESFPLLFQGAMATFGLSVFSMLVSLLVGGVFGLMLSSKRALVRVPALIYVEVWRAVPLIVSILLVYFALPEILRAFYPVQVDSFWAMVFACVLWTSANVAETVRGAIDSVPVGQSEAADSLGLSYFQKMSMVVIPQAVKLMIAPLIGLFTLLLKGTAIGFIIEYRELIRMGQITIERLVIEGHAGASIEIYGVIMVLYFLMCFPLSRLSLFYERKFQVHH